jgi:hypothetical protein
MTGRPQRSPSGPWKPESNVCCGPSVPFRHGKKATSGARGGVRFQEPWTPTSAPCPKGSGRASVETKLSPSGAECAGRPCSTGGRAAQSSLVPPGFVCTSRTNRRFV